MVLVFRDGEPAPPEWLVTCRGYSRRPVTHLAGSLGENVSWGSVCDRYGVVMGRETSRGVRAEHITFTYGNQMALDDVTFEAPPRLVTGLVGPNGAGKTTLIRVLTTILPLQAGIFSVVGHSF